MNPLLQPTLKRPDQREWLRERKERKRPKTRYHRKHKDWLKLVETEPSEIEHITD